MQELKQRTSVSHSSTKESVTNSKARWLGPKRALGVIVSLSLLSILAIGCHDEASGDSTAPAAEAADPAQASASPTSGAAPANAGPANAAPATPVKTGGELNVNYSFIGFENKNVKIGSAWAYFRDGRVEIHLASDNLGATECSHDWNLGRDVADGQLGVVLRSRGISYSVPVTRAPGTYQHLGYTYYYRRAGFDRGTNSGNSAREDMDTELQITAVTDDSVSGQVRIRDQVRGNFVAKICP